MIKRRTKMCRRCGKFKHLFGRGLCKPCYNIEFPTKLKRDFKIKPISQKQVARVKKYSELRFIYLKDHPLCEVEGCSHKASEIHHKGGRVGNALYKDFLAVCQEHHRFIEENPEWAKENGYSISRLKQ